MRSMASFKYMVTTIFLLSLISVLWLFHGILTSVLVGMLLAMMCSGICERLESRIRRNNTLKKVATIISAGLVTILIAGLVFVPLIALLSYVISKVNYHDLLTWKNQAIVWINHVSLKLKLSNEIQSVISGLSGDGSFKKLAMVMLGSLQRLSGSTFELFLIITFLFLFLWYRRSLISFFEALNPLPTEITSQISYEVTTTLQVVFISILVLIIAQGFAFGGLMLFYNYNAPLLGFAAGICSIIPIFGTALVWGPIAINEFAAGHFINGIIIFIYGSLIMGVIIDNFLRLILLKKISNILELKRPINEFLLFFAIASGISVVGFWGVIMGPALVTIFLALSNVYTTFNKSTDSID